MNNSILFLNEKKRLHEPLWMLVCFAMFSFWQMGFIYFMGPALTLNGKTPLPIDMDNVTMLILMSYVCSILWMIWFPQHVIKTQRYSAILALCTAIGLFFPFPADWLKALIYAHIFCCCFMIGFETFILVNYFNEKANIAHLTFAYGIALLLIAIVQNDFFPISFHFFLFATLIALILFLIFLFRMPAEKSSLPQFIKKDDKITAPKRLLCGTFILVFIGSLMGVSGPSVAAEAPHGVFIAYFVDACVSMVLYWMYKVRKIHPFKCVSFCIGLGALGYLMMYVSKDIPTLAYISSMLIGLGMIPCQMLPLYGFSLMKTYPSKFISPAIIFLAMIAVLVQSSMVEAFRNIPVMLNLVYAIIMVTLVIFYLQIEPVFMYSLHRELIEQPKDIHNSQLNDPLNVLSKREREVAELICLGYTNADIAKILHISIHTVKDHTKKIYPKMKVHSRFELSALLNNIKTEKPTRKK